MESRAERFLAAYNIIDKTMKKEFRIDTHVSFSGTIDRVKKRDPIIEKYEADLREFAQLRNAIVHERVEPHYIIAEPHEQIVQRIEHIRDLLIRPEPLIPRFKRDVSSFRIEDSLEAILRTIRQYGFTQFPIYKASQFVGLLTDNGIAGWLANQGKAAILPKKATPITNEGVAPHNSLIVNLQTSLEDILVHEKNKENVIFMSGSSSVFEAREQFLISIGRNANRLHAILITANGRANEPLLGILTARDLIDL